MEEYKKIQEAEVEEKELKKAKEFLKGKIVLRLEDSEEYAHMMGKQALMYDKIRSVDEILKSIDSVTAAEVLNVAKNLLVEEKVKLAMIGPYENEEHFAKLLKY